MTGVADKNIWRILDVNSNRAAEGLRTLEDVARLVREDSVAALWIKNLRHDLTATVTKLDRMQRLAARSTETDAGTSHTLGSESARSDWRSIVSAACERIGQSLRCLEEFSKLVEGESNADFKSLRYKAYDTLAQLELRWSRIGGLTNARLYLLINCSLPIDIFVAEVRRYSEAGVDLFQLRDKDCAGGKLVEYARAAVNALIGTSSKVIINDRIDVALASGAAGVHLGQSDIAFRDARRIAGPDLWIGVSTHDIEQAIAAESAGADYIGCGPTFRSRTKSFDEFPGLPFLKSVAERITIPAFAIGGIDQQNLVDVVEAGMRRVALSSAVHQSPQPLETVAAIKQCLMTE